MYLVTASEIKEMDRKTIEEIGIPGQVLMENAGKGSAHIIVEELSKIRKPLSEIRVGIICGRGNNGGDGFVIARYLFEWGLPITVYLLSNKDRVQGDAAANLRLLDVLNIPVVEIPDIATLNAQKPSMTYQDVWIDAILGTGLNSDVTGYFKEAIEFINQQNKPIISVDIPSGLNSDNGQICGTCICANTTITFAYGKIGHFQYPGAAHTGKLHVVDIGIPSKVVHQINPKQFLITKENIAGGFRVRPADAHKGHTGHLLIIAGSEGKTGAAAMTAMAAMRIGAGLVTIGIPSSVNAIVESLVLEAMTYPLPETKPGILGESAYDAIIRQLPGKRCLAIGPGIGTDESTSKLIFNLLKNIKIPVVIDADGLNILAGQPDILKQLNIPVILTPHPGEMARLINQPTAYIQANRVQCARQFSETYGAILVLKGARTVIAQPNGQVYINPTGNPGMASGGMGDVLTGIIAGLITQGYSPEFSCHAGVFLHGAAADDLAQSISSFGYLASDVIQQLPITMKKILSHELSYAQSYNK